MSESETQGRIWRGTIDGNLLANIRNYYSSRHPWGMTKALAARLERVEAQLAAKDAVIAGLVEALTRINRLTSPGSRTLDDFMRDMGLACDIARAALAFAAEKGASNAAI